MASFFQQIGDALGISSSSGGASAVSPESGSTGTAFSLQLSNNAVLSGAEKLYIAEPGGANITVSGDSPAVIVGGAGNDHLSGGSGSDVIVGGGGTNVLSGGGGTDVFGHAAGATDYITDFSSAAGEQIALASGVTYVSSGTTTVTPSSIGLTGTSPETATVLTFSDHSTVTLLGETGTPDASTWFI